MLSLEAGGEKNVAIVRIGDMETVRLNSQG